MTILLVDDSRAMRLLIARTLRQAGFGDHRVVEAEDGVEGLCVALDEAPDLILSDWVMPGADGLQLLRALRGRGSRVPFGFITALATPERCAAAEQAGASFCVPKPVSAEVLEELLREVGLRSAVGA